MGKEKKVIKSKKETKHQIIFICDRSGSVHSRLGTLETAYNEIMSSMLDNESLVRNIQVTFWTYGNDVVELFDKEVDLDDSNDFIKETVSLINKHIGSIKEKEPEASYFIPVMEKFDELYSSKEKTLLHSIIVVFLFDDKYTDDDVSFENSKKEHLIGNVKANIKIIPICIPLMDDNSELSVTSSLTLSCMSKLLKGSLPENDDYIFSNNYGDKFTNLLDEKEDWKKQNEQ